MSDDPAGAAIDRLISVLTQQGDTLGLMLTEVARLHDREAELTEDVAELGLRVTSLATGVRVGHSLRVVGSDETTPPDAPLEERVATLAETVEQLEARVSDVHTKALRALTALTERKNPA